jgi:hypothetical protein
MAIQENTPGSAQTSVLRGPAAWIRHYYPFTVLGTILFLVSVGLFVHSFTSNNSYGFLLSLTALALLAFLVVGSRIQALRNAELDIVWDSTTPVYSRTKEVFHTLSLRDLKRFPFYRLHFSLRGKLQVSERSFLRYYDDFSSTGDTIVLPLSFPLSGIFHLRGRLLIQDFLGLTRAELGGDHWRRLVIQPRVLGGNYSFNHVATEGSEDQNKFSDSDVERYYMREYVPGDRFRDINWKASSRGDKIYTRISPLAQEKTQIISILFRNAGARKKESLEGALHLDFLKSWLITFLKKTRQENPNYRYEIYLGQDMVPVETDEEMENFTRELAGYYLSPGTEKLPEIPPGGEMYVFTTALDSRLSHFLSSFPGLKVNLFQTLGPRMGVFPGAVPQAVHLSLIQGPWNGLFPGFWSFYKERQLSRVPASGPNIRYQEHKTLFCYWMKEELEAFRRREPAL